MGGAAAGRFGGFDPALGGEGLADAVEVGGEEKIAVIAAGGVARLAVLDGAGSVLWAEEVAKDAHVVCAGFVGDVADDLDGAGFGTELSGEEGDAPGGAVVHKFEFEPFKHGCYRSCSGVRRAGPLMELRRDYGEWVVRQPHSVSW